MPTTTEQALSGQDSLAIMSSADAASRMLGLRSYEEPKVVQEAIERFLDDHLDDAAKNTLGPENAPLALGSLWGNTLLDAYGWTWIKVCHGDWQALGLVDSARNYLALPHQMFVELLSPTSDPSMARPYARFNAIGTNYLPAAEPGSYTCITD